MATFSAVANPTLPGQDNPAFQAALQTWLSFDDTEALPQFSNLALQGNLAAQVFLSQVEVYPYLYADVQVGALHGPDGAGWLVHAAPHVPLAASLSEQSQPGSIFVATEALIEMQEWRAAHTGLVLLRSGDGSALLSIQADVALLSTVPEMAALGRWVGFDIFNELTTYAELGWTEDWSPDNLPAVEEALSQTGVLSSPNLENWYALILSSTSNQQFSRRDWREQGEFILAEPLLEPIATTCVEMCPGHPDICAQNFSYITQYPLYIYHMSPVEWAVSTEDYQTSERFPMDVAALAEHAPIAVAARDNGQRFNICEPPGFVGD